MSRLRSLAVLLLCALWVPATLHCDFEAAGLDELFRCASEHSSAPATKTCGDACDVIESGAYKTAADTSTVPPPALLACVGLLCSIPLRAEAARALVILPRESFDRPRDWVSTWQFVQRAAPAPRAPSDFPA